MRIGKLSLLRSYLGAMHRVLRTAPVIIGNRNLIANDCPFAADLFNFVFAGLVLEGKCKLFLQIGANTGDGKHDCHELIVNHRVKSVLVEPQPDVCDRLRSNYARLDSVKVVNAAIDKTSGRRDIYRLSEESNRFHRLGKKFGTGIASFKREHVWDYFVRNSTASGSNADPSTIIETVSVQCMTFAELKRNAGFERVDVILIDTEGYDFEILKLVDIDLNQPSLIRYEYKHLGRNAAASWQFLIERGYRMVNDPKSGDTIAIHNKFLSLSKGFVT